MSNIGTIMGAIGWDTRDLVRAELQTKKSINKMERSMKGMGRTTRTLGQRLGGLKTVAITALSGWGIGRLATGILKTGAQFEKSMAVVRGVTRTTGEENRAAFEMMRDQARKLGEETEWTANQAAEALKFLGMAGFDAAQATATLPGVLDLATAGNIDLGRAADIATNALTAMGLASDDVGEITKNMTRVSDAFVSAITRSNTNMEMMAESFKYAAPLANAMGVEVERLATWIGKLGDAGIQGSMAGTQLNFAMQKLGKAFKKYGEDTVDAQGRTKDITDFVELMGRKALGTQEIIETFGARGGRAMLVFRQLGVEALREFEQEMINTQGETAKLAETMRDNLDTRFKEFKSAIEGVKLDIFDNMVKDLTKSVENMTKWVRANRESLIGVGTTLMSLAKSGIQQFLIGMATAWEYITYGVQGFSLAIDGVALVFAKVAEGIVGGIDFILAGFEDLSRVAAEMGRTIGAESLVEFGTKMEESIKGTRAELEHLGNAAAIMAEENTKQIETTNKRYAGMRENMGVVKVTLKDLTEGTIKLSEEEEKALKAAEQKEEQAKRNEEAQRAVTKAAEERLKVEEKLLESTQNFLDKQQLATTMYVEDKLTNEINALEQSFMKKEQMLVEALEKEYAAEVQNVAKIAELEAMLDNMNEAALAARLAKLKEFTDNAAKEKSKEVADTARIQDRITDQLKKSTLSRWEYTKQSLEKQYKEYDKHVEDKALLDRWYFQELTDAWMESDKIAAIYSRNVVASWKSATSTMVDDFVAGENMKKSVSKASQDFLIDSFANTAKEMYAKAIDKIVETIGALIGMGAAGSGGSGSLKGGVVGALSEIGLYLTTAVGAMLAGRALASQFKAEGGMIQEYAPGGWIPQNPMGGMIRGGSGAKDDVFLGLTGKTFNFGMGGEFVVNKQSTAKYRGMLEMMNKDRTGALLNNLGAFGAMGLADGGGIQGYCSMNKNSPLCARRRGFAEGGIPWEGVADSLVVGSAASFLHGFYKGAGPFSGLAEMLTFIATAIPAMFAGKGSGALFKGLFEEGGYTTKGFFLGGIFDGIGDFFDSIRDFFDDLIKSITDIMIDVGVTGIDWATDIPKSTWKAIKGAWHWIQDCLWIDPKEFLDLALKGLRAPFRQIAKDIVEPGKMWSNPIDVAIDWMQAVGEIFWDRIKDCFTPMGDAWESSLGALGIDLGDALHTGTPYVPGTGSYQLAEGERVFSRVENKEIVDAIKGGAGGGMTVDGPLVYVEANNSILDEAALNRFAEQIKDKLDDLLIINRRGQLYATESTVRAGIS